MTRKDCSSFLLSSFIFPEKVDVLIVGGGPTGLTLGIELARRGVDHLVVDLQPRPVEPGQSRALAIQARTLEIFQDMGVVQEFLNVGTSLNGLGLRINGQHVCDLNLFAALPSSSSFSSSSSGTSYPMTLFLEQAETERILNERLTQLGSKVFRPVVMWKLDDGWKVPEELLPPITTTTTTTTSDSEDNILSCTDYPITCHLRELSPDGCPANERFESVRCRYLVGCDGAYSTIRKSLGISYDGGIITTVPKRFFVADIDVQWGTPDLIQNTKKAHIVMNDNGLFFIARIGNNWRLVGVQEHDIPQMETIHDPILRLAMPDFTQVQFITNQAIPGSTLVRVHWSSAFTINCRTAQHLKLGRCFLAGDSAHVHPPTYGQGMNTGIQDSYNLGWKLASVLKGGADPALLESYGVERKRVARNIVAMTSRPFSFLNYGKPSSWVRCCLSTFAPYMTRFDSFLSYMFQNISMLNHKYDQSSDVIGRGRLWYGSREPGERAPDALVRRIPMPPDLKETSRNLLEFLHSGNHTLLLCLNVLPYGTKAKNLLGCNASDSAAVRWNLEAFKKLSKVGRLVNQCLGQPANDGQGSAMMVSQPGVQVAWLICGMVEEGKITVAKQSDEETSILQLMPQDLLVQIRHAKMGGSPLVLCDHDGEVCRRYGFGMSLSTASSAHFSSGCFLLIRPDGYIAYNAYAGDTGGTAAIVDYALRYFSK